MPPDGFVVVTSRAAKGWTQTWTWTWTWTPTQNQTQHRAAGGWGSWDEHADGPPMPCLPAPVGIRVLNESLNISAAASPPLPFHQMLTVICEVVWTGPTQQNSCRDHPRPRTSQLLSTRLAWQASKSHPKCSSATQPAKFPDLPSCSRDVQSFFSVWSLTGFVRTPSVKFQENPEKPPPHRFPGLWHVLVARSQVHFRE